MKFAFKIAFWSGFIQFILSSLACLQVYTAGSDPYAGVLTVWYFALFGYCPWALLIFFSDSPINAIFPELGQNIASLNSYFPSILFATINWFILGFIIGYAIHLTYYRKKTR